MRLREVRPSEELYTSRHARLHNFPHRRHLEPVDLVAIAVDIDAVIEVETVADADLPGDWRTYPAPPSLSILEGMTTLGVRRYVPLLGVMELTFATLFVIPATFKLGFVLASCYFAGAIATELSHDALKVNPFIPIVLLWIGAFIRDRSILF